MKLRNLFVSMIIVVLVFLINHINVTAASFGVTPAALENDLLLSGSTYRKRFVLTRQNPDFEQVAKISIDSDVADWINIEPGLEVDLPRGEQQVPIYITVNVPQDAAKGTFSGMIEIIPQKVSTDGIGIQQGVQISMDLKIVEDTVEIYDIINVNIENFHSNQYMPITMQVTNNGNAKNSYDELIVKVYDTDKNFIKELSTTQIPAVEAFTTQDIEVQIHDHGLSEATYYGEVAIKEDNEVIYENDSIFDVLGETAEEQVESSEESDETTKMLCIAIPLLILVLVLLIAVFSKKDRKEK